MDDLARIRTAKSSVQQKSSPERIRRKTLKLKRGFELRRRRSRRGRLGLGFARRRRGRVYRRVRLGLGLARSRGRWIDDGGVALLLFTSRRIHRRLFLLTGDEKSGTSKDTDVFSHNLKFGCRLSYGSTDLVKSRAIRSLLAGWWQ
jgi:hypothetical protein